MAAELDGAELAAATRDCLRAQVDRLVDRGVRPGLATVHAGSDPAAAKYVRLKQRDCEDLGVAGRHVDLDPAAPASALHETIEELNADPDIHGILVQKDVRAHVDWLDAVEQIDPEKDVDGVHPRTTGRLVAGRPSFVPCTALGVERLLVHGGVELDGRHVVVVNHSNIVGKPLANLLVQRPDTVGAGETPVTDGRATVTLCHEETSDLAAKTRAADVVVVAVGIPEFLDGSTISEGAAVVDVGISHVERDDGTVRQVGDVHVDSVAPKASVITPNPGGVGPMTRAMLQYNTVRAAIRQSGVVRDGFAAEAIPSLDFLESCA